MLELVNANYNACSIAKAQNAHSTWGKGSTGPSKWMDAGAVHPSLKGVKMVSQHGNMKKQQLTVPSPTPPSSLAQPTCPVLTCSTTSTSHTTFLRSSCATCSA
jgi:hypothetical protein